MIEGFREEDREGEWQVIDKKAFKPKSPEIYLYTSKISERQIDAYDKVDEGANGKAYQDCYELVSCHDEEDAQGGGKESDKNIKEGHQAHTVMPFEFRNKHIRYAEKDLEEPKEHYHPDRVLRKTIEEK